jgi:hypothetical protein
MHFRTYGPPISGAVQAVEEVRRRSPSPGILGEAYGIGSALAYFGLPALWSCVSDKIRGVERAIKAGQGK